MSSSQQTTNLGLPIYGDSDVPNWKDTNTPFQTLDDIIGQGGGGSNVVPLLDFDNAIALTSTAITTTKDGCVIGGADGQNNSIVVIINGKNCNHYDSSGRVYFVNIPNIPSGSTIKLSRNNSGNFMWFVPYKYQAVDPVINVYNEAEVELNYTTPLHTFSAGNLTYTATKTCWLFGSVGKGNAWVFLSINGTSYSLGGWTSTYATVPLVNIKLKKGDVVTVSTDSDMLYVLEGTISGSVGSIGEPVFDFAHPVFTFQNSTGHTSYTADHDCWLVGTFGMATLGNCDLLIDGTSIAHARYNAEACNIPIQYKILSGSTVSLSGATASLYGTLHILNEV